MQNYEKMFEELLLWCSKFSFSLYFLSKTLLRMVENDMKTAKLNR